MKTIQRKWSGVHSFACVSSERPFYANYGPLLEDEFKAVIDDNAVYHQFDGISVLFYREYDIVGCKYQVVMHDSEDEVTFFDTHKDMMDLYAEWAAALELEPSEMYN